MVTVPGSLVQHFLLGRVGVGELQRFTQDAGVVTDVWLSFAEDLTKPRRVLLTPVDGVPAVQAAAVIHKALQLYRARGAGRPEAKADEPGYGIPTSRAATGVAPLEGFVAVTLYFDELVRVVLPLTEWWSSKDLRCLQPEGDVRDQLRDSLCEYILTRLGSPDASVTRAEFLTNDGVAGARRVTGLRVLEASYIVALIGLFAVASQEAPWRGEDPKLEAMASWVSENARRLAAAGVGEVSRPATEVIADALANAEVAGKNPIQRVFLDRESHLADGEALRTVKADAADRLFNIECKSLTWAIIDSGVAADHPAFRRYERGPDGRETVVGTRIKGAYDLTLIDRIRNFDLAIEDKIEREMAIANVMADLRKLPGRRPPEFEREAPKILRLIGEQLRRRLLPDWALIEPLIRIVPDDGAALLSDHGTHVAGILAADWREPPPGDQDGAPEQVVLRGVCPDISIYDLRVLHPSLKNTEFAVIAALEFVRHLNSRAAGPPVIHGVNISLSIPHEVRNYGCGVTPICAACDDLVHSGVVVVAAAGNRGWNEREQGFGNFVFCSITDPGNAQQAITVGATHRLKPHTYGVSYFSSRGPTGDGRIKPDLVAPGEKIRGPVRGGADDELDGTSMAAPFVSGAAAMLMARNRELMRNPQRIKQILCETATDLGRERYFQGHGLVDVLRALQSI